MQEVRTDQDVKEILSLVNIASGASADAVSMSLSALYEKTKSLPRLVAALNSIWTHEPQLFQEGLVDSRIDVYCHPTSSLDAVAATPHKDVLDLILSSLEASISSSFEKDKGWPIHWASDLLDDMRFAKGSDAEAMQTLLMTCFDDCCGENSTVESRELVVGIKQLQRMIAD